MLRRLITACLSLLLLFGQFLPASVYARDIDDSDPPVVIFIPGIMGSELFLDGKRVWPDKWDDAEKLNYDDHQNDIDHGLPLGWTGTKSRESDNENFYGGFDDFFSGRVRLHAFGYDWRHTNAINADRLKTFIDDVKAQEKVDKVSIVAHSMGGLVAKKYILNTKGASVDKFISVGTPYFGSPEAFIQLKDGYYYNGWFQLAAKEHVRTIPAVYELLPNEMYFNLNNTAYLGTRRLDSDGKIVSRTAFTYDQTKTDLSNRFRGNLVNAAENFQQGMTDTVGKYVNFYRIIGDSQDTIGFIFNETYKGWFNRDKTRWVTAPVNGDGTVPIAGAARGPKELQTTFFAPQSHTNLISNRDVLNGILSILNGQKPNLRYEPATPNKLRFMMHRTIVFPLRTMECPV